MEINVRTLAQGSIRAAEVCVIGAGPAGLALAEGLRSRGVDVLVMEQGGRLPVNVSGDPGSDAPPLSAADAAHPPDAPPLPYGPVAGTRAFGVGGTATIWNTVLHGMPMAKYVALEPSDLEVRPWIPHSGWPIGWDALDRFYDAAHALAGLAPRVQSPAETGRGHPVQDLGGTGLETAFYHYGPAARFTRELPDRIAGDDRATLLLGATLMDLRWSAARGRVAEAAWASEAGVHGRVRARIFVLAAGTIENARILLAACASHGGFEASPWAGRGFMEHPIDTTLELTTRAEALAPPGGFYSMQTLGEGESIVGRFALGDALLSSLGIPRASVRLLPADGPRVLERPGVRHSLRRAVPFERGRRAGGRLVRSLWRASRAVAGARYRLWIDLEQVPEETNRVVLSGRRDALGRPVASLDWRWSDEDEGRRLRTVEAVARELERAGAGRVERVPDGGLDPRAHHHMGTTRMSSGPADGVVDGDLRVHGAENLYVVGPSVFPTGGCANPTLTAVALALRLADHLAPRA